MAKKISFRVPPEKIGQAAAICRKHGCTVYGATVVELDTLASGNSEAWKRYAGRETPRTLRIPGPHQIMVCTQLPEEKAAALKTEAGKRGFSPAAVCKLYVMDIADGMVMPPEAATQRPQRTDVKPWCDRLPGFFN